MKKIFKKAYVSLEVVIICAVVLTAGIGCIAHFWTDGKSNQSVMVEKQEEVYYAAWNGNPGNTGGNIGGDTNNDSATFIVNEDVIVIDYALPINVDVLDNDFLGASVQLVGIGNKDKKPTEESTNALADGFKNEIITNFGEAKIKDNKIVYNLKNMSMNDVDDFVYAIEYSYYDDGMKTEYYYGDVSIVPATTIYCEDNFEAINYKYYERENKKWSEIPKENWTSEIGWQTVQEGSSNSDITQNEDRPGFHHLPSVDANNVYGYDKAYELNTKYSLDGAKKLTVHKDSYGTVEFEYTGTGFDVISLTGNNTGVIMATVTNLATNKKKNYMVNTYFGYKYENGEWVLTDSTDSSALYQIPVLKIINDTYGDYKVSLTYGYNSSMDLTGEGSTDYDIYFDAVRIYNPAGIEPTNPFIKEVYIRDDEAYPLHTDIRDVTNDALAGIDTTSEQGKGFINENSLLPNNEIYLYPGQFIAFRVNVNAYKNVEGDNILSSVQLGIKLLTGDSNSYEIYNVTDSSIIANKYNKTIDTKADMNYDLTNLKDNIIVVRNTGNEIISLTKLKTTFITNPADLLITEPPIIVSINDIRKVINVIE